MAFDRGYTDYEWFISLDRAECLFCDAFEGKRRLRGGGEGEFHSGAGVLRDEVVFFYKLAQASQEAFFRRIEFDDEEHDRVLVFLTSIT